MMSEERYYLREQKLPSPESHTAFFIRDRLYNCRDIERYDSIGHNRRPGRMRGRMERRVARYNKEYEAWLQHSA